MWSLSFVLHIFTPLVPPHSHAPSHQHGSIFLCPTGLGYVSSLDPWNEGKRDDVSILRVGLKRIGPLVASDFCPGSCHSSSLSPRTRCMEHSWTQPAIWRRAPQPACRSSEQSRSEKEPIVVACHWDPVVAYFIANLIHLVRAGSPKLQNHCS